MNITRAEEAAQKVSDLFKILGHPARLDILQEIGQGEACVCHLEAALDLRQAYISQHLMVLRDADLLTSRQEGRYVFYRLRDPETLTLIDSARKLLGFPPRPQTTTSCDCPCPTCHPS